MLRRIQFKVTKMRINQLTREAKLWPKVSSKQSRKKRVHVCLLFCFVSHGNEVLFTYCSLPPPPPPFIISQLHSWEVGKGGGGGISGWFLSIIVGIDDSS